MTPHIQALHDAILHGNAGAAANTARYLAIRSRREAYREAAEARFLSEPTLPITPLKTWTPPRGGSAAVAAIGGVL